ncbi:MAG: peptidoglycan DD-metalloendopeptidase family protein [Deltaproteobacteria bacterium]|nr:peptidoglycan DD-metalloendopeptidase family protein [Deltaproteobacteria bacterium]
MHAACRTLFATLLAVALAACAGQITGEDLDPASTDEEIGDDGPLPEDEPSDDVPVDVPDVDENVFQLPFPCGEVWAGQTRTNHSPQLSVDFNRADDDGDTVVAAASGTITRVANTGSTSYGRWIEIAHSGNRRTRYAHLSSQTVTVGQFVRRGQKIGTLGNTGGSTGPHLHYEQHLNGMAVRVVFDEKPSLYYGSKNYTSQNSCGVEAGSVVGRVNTDGADLVVRAGASTATATVGSVADGAMVVITCQTQGESVTGTYGTSTLWDKIGTGYIPDAFVSTGSDGQVAPDCP